MATVVLIIILVGVAAAVLIYNSLVGLRNRVENGWQQISCTFSFRTILVRARRLKARAIQPPSGGISMVAWMASPSICPR